jgi:carboxyl-terminal processing protease
MKHFFKRKIMIPVIALTFLWVGVSFKNDFFEIAKQIEIFTGVFKTVNQNYVDETNAGEMMDIAIKNMLKELDPYTVFFNEQDVIKYKINNTGEYTGIGAMVQRKDGKVYLKEIYKGFPADKAGLKAGDELLQIGDVTLKEYQDDASLLLKGAKNTSVNIIYIRQGTTRKASIVLNEVEIKAVPYYALLKDKTGYIVLSKFNEKASAETKAALLDLKQQGATKIILDLRGNPGGLLHEAVNICNLFVAKNELIVATKSKNVKYNLEYRTKNEPNDLEIPLAIIVDGKSASASEIVAGAIQDLDRGVVLGSRSFGKGLVQRPLDLSYGTQVKVTISRYYTPSGRCIQALDYSKKDENGKAIKKVQKEYNAFKTKAGRTVYDGGGVLPDIEITSTKLAHTTETLLKNEAIFNFATQLYYKNPTVSEVPSVTDADFLTFKSYIKQEKIVLDTETSKALKAVIENAKKEQIEEQITIAYKQLETALEKSQEAALEKNKEQIKKQLQEELIIRHQYREGLYLYYTKNNPEIEQAINLLNNTAQYQSILKK